MGYKREMKIEYKIPDGYRPLEIGEEVHGNDLVALDGTGYWHKASDVPRHGGWTVRDQGALIVRKLGVECPDCMGTGQGCNQHGDSVDCGRCDGDGRL